MVLPLCHRSLLLLHCFQLIKYGISLIDKSTRLQRVAELVFEYVRRLQCACCFSPRILQVWLWSFLVQLSEIFLLYAHIAGLFYSFTIWWHLLTREAEFTLFSEACSSLLGLDAHSDFVQLAKATNPRTFLLFWGLSSFWSDTFLIILSNFYRCIIVTVVPGWVVKSAVSALRMFTVLVMRIQKCHVVDLGGVVFQDWLHYGWAWSGRGATTRGDRRLGKPWNPACLFCRFLLMNFDCGRFPRLLDRW